jgi:hypothetical protein
MRQLMLTAGAAALAIAAPALAQGQGNGNHGGNHGGPAKAEKGPDKARGPDRAKGPDKFHGPEKRAEMRPEKARGNDAKPQPQSPRQAMRDDPGKGPAKARFEKDERQAAGRANLPRATRDVVRIASRQWQDGRYRYDDRRFLIPVTADCPPGLAKKNNGCLPPGQVRKIEAPRNWGSWYPVRYLGNDYDWRYGNGYLYRVGSGGLVSGVVPLLGGALFGGRAWPVQYTDYAVPTYYDRYYGFDRGFGDNYDYRYAQNAIFAVDPQTQMIQGIAALLTGDTWAVGQPMPAGYDFYNVPPDWRGRYADTPDSWYRYSDGYVYEVDPTTQLVRAVIELIA